MAATYWSVTAHDAQRLRLPHCTATVAPHQPQYGLQDVSIDGAMLPSTQLLGVDLGPAGNTAPADCYVRGADLVVAYANAPRPELRTEIYWRSVAQPAAGALAAIELLASVQTSLLDSQPAIEVRSQLPDADVWTLEANQSARRILPAAPGASQITTAGCHLFRLADAELSYAQMVHPADLEPARLSRVALGDSRPAGWQLCHPLFASRLEKGVILRARVLGALLPRESDEALARAIYAAFAAETPPLTR